jgi:hypothetical protein
MAAVAMVVGLVPACGDPATDRSEDLPPPVRGQLDQVRAAPPPDERQMLIAGNHEELTDWTAEDYSEPARSAPVSVVLYGDPWSDEAFEEQDVGIWSSADPEILHAVEGEQDDQRDRVKVRGHRAYVARSSRDPQRGPTGATELAWLEADGLAISLRSHRYSVDELVSVADELEVTGGSAHLTDQESDRGLGPVYEVEDLAWSILGQPSGPGQRQVNYWAVPRSTGDVHFEIKTWTFSNTTGIDDLLTLFRFDHPGAHAETARDREVVVYEWPTTDELEGDERVDVMWLEAPTVAVTVQGWGGNITVDEMLAFLETLRPTSPADAEQILVTRERTSTVS